MPNFVLASGLSFVSSRPLGFRNPSSIEDTNVARPPKAAQALPGPGRAKRGTSKVVCQTESSHNGVRCQGRRQALRRRAALLGVALATIGVQGVQGVWAGWPWQP